MDLSESARCQLAKRLEDRAGSPASDVCFRLTATRKGGARVTVCRPEPDDLTFKQGELVVLAVASDIAPRYADCTFDLRTDESGTQQLVILPSPAEAPQED